MSGMQRAGRMLGLVFAAGTLAWAGPASAQNWPTKPVRIIVPFSAGAATDLIPRTVFDTVSKQVGQNFVVDNRPGGGGAIGIGAVLGAPPDGQTVLVHSNSAITTPAMQKMPWDPPRDLSGITILGSVPLVLVIAANRGIKTLKEFVDLARSKPGALNYAAAGIGSPPHLTMERFRTATGITGQIIPFKGPLEAINEIIAGRIDVYFSPVTPALPFIQSGKVIPLAVSSARRAAALPDVPTTLESGYPDSDFEFWVGMFVHKKTPRDLVKQMHAVTVKGLKDQETLSRFKKMGVDLNIESPEEFDKRIERETKLAVDVAKAAGVGLKK